MGETTVLFVKQPDLDRAEDILGYLFEWLEKTGKFNHNHFERVPATQAFLSEFYSHLKDPRPEVFKNVVQKYKGAINLSLFHGRNIVDRVRYIAGPTRFNENQPWTIRGHFGPYENPNTIVHASAPEEVNRDLVILEKHNMIMYEDYI